MFRKLCLFSGLMAAATLGRAAQVTVDVYDTGTTNTYTNGVGGIATGPGAVTASVGNMNADPTVGVTSYTIRIHDTDGVRDIYVGDLPISKNNTTIYQVANGSGNDTGAEIRGAANVSSNAAILVAAANFKLIGLTPLKPLRVAAANSGQGYVTGLDRNLANSVLWQNLEYLGTPGATGDHNDFNVNGRTVNQTFRNVRFTVLNGPRFEAAGTTINDSKFDTPGFKLVADKTKLVVNNSSFGPSAAGIVSTSGTEVTLNDCSFTSVGRIVSGVAPRGWFGGTLTLNRPTFPAPNGDVAFWIGNTTGSVVNINNANLSGVATVLTGRVLQGTMNFTSCTLFNDIDTLDDAAGRGVTGAGARINFDRSIVACNIGAGATTASTAAVRITGRNTLFNTFNRPLVIALSNASTVADSVITTHCTFQGLSLNVLLDTSANDRIEGNYTIYDASAAVSTSANGTNELFGRGNLVYPNGFIARPADTLIADPKLLPTGRPTAQSLAAVVDRAYGSKETVDGDGIGRPQGNGRDLGAYELAGATNNWATALAAQAETAPVIDGTIGVNEWKTTPITIGPDLLVVYGGSKLATPGATTGADLFGTIYLMWDSSALYMAARVNDNDVQYLRNQGVALNASDVVQLATDHRLTRATDTSTPGIYIHDIAPGQASNPNVAAYWQHWPTQVGNPSNELGNYPDTFPDAVFAGRTKSGEYEIELKLPWANFLPNPPTPAIGQELGYLALIADYDAGAFHDLFWNGGNGVNMIGNPSQWNLLRLVGVQTVINAARGWDIYN